LVSAPHEGAHVEFAHTSVAPHAVPHAPQCAASARRSASHPFVALPSQSAKFASHAAIAHVPAVHVAPAWAKSHAMPHPPQFVVESSAVSHPFDGSPSQSPNPASHRMPHEAAAQKGVEFAPDGQLVPHAPQASGSFCVSRHAPEQSVSPAPHETVHTDVEQT
jgi:hypothetical protein